MMTVASYIDDIQDIGGGGGRAEKHYEKEVNDDNGNQDVNDDNGKQDTNDDKWQ